MGPAATGHHVTYCRWIAGALFDRGIPCLVVGPRALCEAVTAVQPNLATHPIEFDPGGNRGRREARRTAFVRQAADAVRLAGSDHVHLLYLDGFTTALAANRLRFATATLHATLHGGRIVPGAAAPGLWQTWQWLLLAGMLRRGLHLFVHGEALAKAITVRVRGASIDALRYPIESSATTGPSMAVARERLGLSGAPKLLLAFGGTRRDKGADVAIAALRHLPEEVHLAIAGEAEHFGEDELLRLANQYGVAHRVLLRLGYVDSADVTAWFSAADVVLIPYHRSFSGQSGPLTIAAGLGRPIVATDGWVTGETVRRYRLGELAPAGNAAAFAAAVSRVLENPPKSDLSRFRAEHALDGFTEAVVKGYQHRVPGPPNRV